MSNRVKIELNKAGVRELLRSKEVASYIEGIAREKKAALGEGYEVSTFTGRNRVNVSIYADTPAAMRDVMENNSLVKAVDG